MTISRSPARRYRILVEGTLDANWSECLGGLTIAVHPQTDARPITALSGPLADQAALHGVLNTLFMLNLPLLLVERTVES